MLVPLGRAGRTPRDPWFRQSPHVTLAVIAVLFTAVLALRLAAGTPSDAYSMFYALPVALAATAFGQRAGVAAALLAVAFIWVWVLVRDVELGPTGWATRAVPILLLGFLLGSAADRTRRAEDTRRQAEEARRQAEVGALLHREAIEINDSLIQRMAAAKWALEDDNTDAALRILAAGVSDAQGMVSRLIRRAGMADRTEQRSHPAGLQHSADSH